MSWRWVLFVNMPIGIAAALAAPRVLAESGRQRDQFDLPGAVTGTGGVTALVYGLSTAATSPSGVSHWADTKVVASLAASAVLLAAFAVIEARSRHALLPVRLLRDRNRTGAYLIMLGVGTAIFGMFFFVTVFMQAVWGYSALETGVAYLPFAAGVLAGVRNRCPAGAPDRCPPAAAGRLHGRRRRPVLSVADRRARQLPSGLLGPILVTGAGFGLLFVPLSLVALSRVAEHDSGVASSLLNTGQQVGGSIGLAVLGTVAWTIVANSGRTQAARAATATGHRVPARGPCPQRSTATPWPPGSPARSWSRPGSRCSP